MAKVTAKPTVRFSQKVYQQMRALTDECSIEISAMGIIATDEQKEEAGVKEDYYVLELFVIDQECTGVTTDLDDDAFIDLVMELREKGIKSEQVCFWWHSHVNMGTGHSGTDEAQIERFDFDEVCISAITNKKGDLNLRIDMFKPFRYSFEKCPYVVDQIDMLPDGWAKEMVEKHVTTRKVIPERLNIKKKTTPTYTTRYYGSGWNNDTGYTRQIVKPGNSTTTTNKSWFDLDEEEEADQYDAELEVSLPEPLSLLESAWEQSLIPAQDFVELYSRWYAKELSTEEVIQELELVHNITEKSFEEEDEEDVDDQAEVIRGIHEAFAYEPDMNEFSFEETAEKKTGVSK